MSLQVHIVATISYYHLGVTSLMQMPEWALKTWIDLLLTSMQITIKI